MSRRGSPHGYDTVDHHRLDPEPAFRAYLQDLNYPWVDESDNEAFRLFLR